MNVKRKILISICMEKPTVARIRVWEKNTQKSRKKIHKLHFPPAEERRTDCDAVLRFEHKKSSARQLIPIKWPSTKTRTLIISRDKSNYQQLKQTISYNLLLRWHCNICLAHYLFRSRLQALRITNGIMGKNNLRSCSTGTRLLLLLYSSLRLLLLNSHDISTGTRSATWVEVNARLLHALRLWLLLLLWWHRR